MAFAGHEQRGRFLWSGSPEAASILMPVALLSSLEAPNQHQIRPDTSQMKDVLYAPWSRKLGAGLPAGYCTKGEKIAHIRTSTANGPHIHAPWLLSSCGARARPRVMLGWHGWFGATRGTRMLVSA